MHNMMSVPPAAERARRLQSLAVACAASSLALRYLARDACTRKAWDAQLRADRRRRAPRGLRAGVVLVVGWMLADLVRLLRWRRAGMRVDQGLITHHVMGTAIFAHFLRTEQLPVYYGALLAFEAADVWGSVCYLLAQARPGTYGADPRFRVAQQLHWWTYLAIRIVLWAGVHAHAAWNVRRLPWQDPHFATVALLSAGSWKLFLTWFDKLTRRVWL